MALYFITVETNSRDRCKRLISRLKSINARRVLEVTWCFERYNTNPVELKNYFKKFLSEGDGLVIIESKKWA